MTNDIRAITDRIERREADRRQQLGRRAVLFAGVVQLLQVLCATAVWRETAKKVLER